MEMINNEISFAKDFVDQLMSLVPKQVIKYWNPVATNSGLVRYDSNSLDAVYIHGTNQYVNDNLIKFNVVKGKFEFDSIYCQYDVTTETNIHPWEHRYDKDLNVIATYKFAESIEEKYLSTQYKEGKKLKEYVYATAPFNPPVFKNLIKSNLIEFKDNVIDNINCLKVEGNIKIIYYWIR
jgi:hypothetical protein